MDNVEKTFMKQIQLLDKINCNAKASEERKE